MSILSLDPQATGWRDDGHEAGVLRTEVVRGLDLVRMPLRDGHFTYNGSSTSSQRGAWQENGDGTASGFLINNPAGGTAPAAIDLLFVGRVFGVRLIPGYNSPNVGPGITDFSVYIDGQSYKVTPYRRRTEVDAIDTITTGEATFMVADDLPPGIHRATLVFPPHPTINARWAFLGYAVERAAGYSEPAERLSLLGTPTVLTTTSTDIRNMLAGSGSSKYPRGVRGGLLMNTTASPVTFTLALVSTDIYSVVVPATSSTTFQFPGLIGNLVTDMKVRASAAASLTLTLVEGL